MSSLHTGDLVQVIATKQRGEVASVRAGKSRCIVKFSTKTHDGQTVNFWVEYRDRDLERVEKVALCKA